MSEKSLLQKLTLENIAIALLIILIAWAIIKVSQYVIHYLAQKVSNRWRLRFLSALPIIRLVVIIEALVLIIPKFITPTVENVMAMLGALAVAIGFAFKDYVSSLIAGLVTLYERPYRPGDWIALDGHYGEVTRVNTRSVELVTQDDNLIIIPHQKIWTDSIVNANGSTNTVMCTANFYLHPDHDGALVYQTLYDVALTSALLRLDLPIKVVVKEHAWGTEYALRGYVLDLCQQGAFITDLTLRGKSALRSLGIQFAAIEPEPETAH
ncbi:MAG: mechanosensitive ion channel domain-containing protein [Thiofilum sp.]|uniref:mechanosensitive ion channel family protein n=1 Tax=Thiofilum sp. TaxID=2212733 RepID=UPI0025FC10FF|nr:mechanosensitive ion channel domain-containing protein [Thiofilum sp.]